MEEPSHELGKGAVWGFGVAGGLGALFFLDEPIREETQKHAGATFQQASKSLSDFVRVDPVLGFNGALLALGGAQVYATGEAGFLRAALVSTEAQLLSGLMTEGLKKGLGRERPSQSGKERGKSFPSGHATWAFATASVFADRYGPPISWLSYGLAGGIAASRVVLDAHYASDVLAGAALGTWVGLSLSRWQGGSSRTSLGLVPFLGPRLKGLSVEMRF